jgi:ABC-2 type transport system ATP-binding protein
MSIEFRDLSVRRGRRTVLDAVDLTLNSSLTALMGPNGAGKSTLLLALVGLIPYSGSILVDGTQVDHRRSIWLDRQVGFAPQSVSWPGGLSARAVCELAAFLRRVPGTEMPAAVRRALELAGAVGFSDQSIRSLSGGQRRRVSLAQALVHSPTYIVLDEPTSELDPIFREQFAQTVEGLRREHVLLVSTHSIDDVTIWNGDVVVLGSGEPPRHLRSTELGQDPGARVACIRRAFSLDQVRSA